VLDGAVTSHYEVTTHPEIFDGVRLHKGQSVAVIRHNARVVLSCERVILNFLQRMSGIATLTRKFVEAVHGTKARILDTRKTAPGLRVIDKYAVRCGGGQNHRLDLSDGVLIKNNHIATGWRSCAAVERALHNRRGAQPVESKYVLFKNWNRCWPMAVKPSCSTTCRRKPWLRPLSTVHGWNAAFR